VLVATRVAQTGGSVEDVAVPLALRDADRCWASCEHWDEGTCSCVRASLALVRVLGVHDPLDDLSALASGSDARVR
jgi:hypothetical protein